MNVHINNLVKSLLQKDTLDQCSLQELELFAERNPYFGAAQLLLTKKLQTEKHNRYDEQLQKTFLFFHNPLWVEKLLNETGNAQIIPPEKKEEPVLITENKSEPVTDNHSESPAMAATNSFESISIQPELLAERAVELKINTEEKVVEQPALKTELVASSNNELLFEPFHTVDYFASQGIKFKEEEKPKDKFGQQLKSFTDWLKTMKRLPVSELARTVEGDAGLSPVAEKKVEELAEYSLTERAVLTEAMAEVWEKQGNAAKAIEVYTKLSLLDPSKSPYFAAKIEHLKKTN
jgi:hypothetical protein